MLYKLHIKPGQFVAF